MTNRETIPESRLLTDIITGESPTIYMERSGKGSKRLSEALLRPPESPLSLEEANEAIQYEAELCDTVVLGDEATGTNIDAAGNTLTIEQLVRKHKGGGIQAPTFFAEAFLKGEVHVQGFEGTMRQFSSAEDVYKWLALAADAQSVPSEVFIEMARQSAQYYKLEMKEALLRETVPSESLLDAMPIVINPKETLEFAKAGLAAREHLKSERQRLKERNVGLDGAKRAFVDIYSKRINGMVTGDIAIMSFLVDQARLIGDEITEATAIDALPPSMREVVISRGYRAALSRRFDFIRNGMGHDENGRASAVDSSVFEQPEVDGKKNDQPPIFTLEEKEQLKKLMMSKEEIHALFKEILAEMGMLSSEDESTWSPGRGDRAADDLFQVVYHPKKATMAVDGTNGVLFSPNGERSVYDVLTVASHELTHINQAQADKALGAVIRIGNLKGRRVSMLRESGANLVQRQLEQILFGQSKPVAFAYARALQTLEAGGGVTDATVSFYNEKVRVSPGISRADAAGEAADRVLRLVSSAGISSQPMSYAEENILNRELADAPLEVQQRATQVTTLDLDDQLRLHTFGLLPEVPNASIDWTPVLMKHIEPYISKALATA